jgi:hypothetical protein
MFTWLFDCAKAAWDGLVDLAIGAGKLVIAGLKAVGQAIGISALPLHIIRGDDSLAHAATAFTEHAVSETVRMKTGVAVKAGAAKASALASKAGLAKLAALFGKVSLAGSVAVGTTIWATGFVLAFVGVIWLAKRAVKKLGEFIEVVSAVEDTDATAEGLALVA